MANNFWTEVRNKYNIQPVGQQLASDAPGGFWQEVKSRYLAPAQPGAQAAPAPGVAGAPLPGAGVRVENADGTFSTERTIGVNIDGREYVIPTLVGGKQFTTEQAIDEAKTRGLQNYPNFATVAEAESYASKRSAGLGAAAQGQPQPGEIDIEGRFAAEISGAPEKERIGRLYDFMRRHALAAGADTDEKIAAKRKSLALNVAKRAIPGLEVKSVPFDEMVQIAKRGGQLVDPIAAGFLDAPDAETKRMYDMAKAVLKPKYWRGFWLTDATERPRILELGEVEGRDLGPLMERLKGDFDKYTPEQRQKFLSIASGVASTIMKPVEGHKLTESALRNIQQSEANFRSSMEQWVGFGDADYTEFIRQLQAIAAGGSPVKPYATGALGELEQGMYDAAGMAPEVALSMAITGGTASGLGVLGKTALAGKVGAKLGQLGKVGKAAMATGKWTASAAPSAAFWQTQEYPELNSDLVRAGVPPEQAKRLAFVGSAVIGAIEMIEPHFGLKGPKLKVVQQGLRKRIAEYLVQSTLSFGKEWGEEWLQAGTGNLTKQIAAVISDAKFDWDIEKEEDLEGVARSVIPLVVMQAPHILARGGQQATIGMREDAVARAEAKLAPILKARGKLLETMTPELRADLLGDDPQKVAAAFEKLPSEVRNALASNDPWTLSSTAANYKPGQIGAAQEKAAEAPTETPKTAASDEELAAKKAADQAGAAKAEATHYAGEDLNPPPGKRPLTRGESGDTAVPPVAVPAATETAVQPPAVEEPAAPRKTRRKTVADEAIEEGKYEPTEEEWTARGKGKSLDVVTAEWRAATGKKGTAPGRSTMLRDLVIREHGPKAPTAAPEATEAAEAPVAAPAPATQPEAAGEAEGAAPFRQRVEAAIQATPVFANSKVEVDEANKTATVTTPTGKSATIYFDADEKLRIAEQHSKPDQKGKVARGAYVYQLKTAGKPAMAPGIYLGSDATHETLNHEAVHWMEDVGVVSKAEVKKHGGREAMAKGYAAWVADGRKTANSVFEKVWKFLESVLGLQTKPSFADIEGRTQAPSKPFGEQVKDVLPAVRGVFRGRQDAEDLMQDTWVQAVEDEANFDPAKGTLQAWLKSYVAPKVLSRKVSGEKRHPTSSLVAEPPAPAEPTIAGPKTPAEVAELEGAELEAEYRGWYPRRDPKTRTPDKMKKEINAAIKEWRGPEAEQAAVQVSGKGPAETEGKQLTKAQQHSVSRIRTAIEGVLRLSKERENQARRRYIENDMDTIRTHAQKLGIEVPKRTTFYNQEADIALAEAVAAQLEQVTGKQPQPTIGKQAAPTAPKSVVRQKQAAPAEEVDEALQEYADTLAATPPTEGDVEMARQQAASDKAEMVAAIRKVQAKGGRARLADVRKALSDWTREEVDETLREMNRSDEVALYHGDNPRELTDEDRAAVWKTGSGDGKRHFVYLQPKGESLAPAPSVVRKKPSAPEAAPAPAAQTVGAVPAWKPAAAEIRKFHADIDSAEHGTIDSAVKAMKKMPLADARALMAELGNTTYGNASRKEILADIALELHRKKTDASRPSAGGGPTDAQRRAAAKQPAVPTEQGEGKAKEPWEMTREEYFNDPDRVQADVGGGDRQWKVSYTYTNPTPGGPFKGSMVIADKVQKGDIVSGMMGSAKVTAVSKEKPRKLDNMELFTKGKAAHRRAVETALSAGKPVPAEVLADYPDLQPKAEAGKGGEVTRIADKLVEWKNGERLTDPANFRTSWMEYDETKQQAIVKELVDRGELPTSFARKRLNKKGAYVTATELLDGLTRNWATDEFKPKPAAGGETEALQQDTVDAEIRKALESELTPKAEKPVKSVGKEKSESRRERTKKKLDDAMKEFRDTFGTTFDTGVNPQKVVVAAKLAAAAVNHGISVFADFIQFVSSQIGRENTMKISVYLESAWRMLGQRKEFGHIDAAGKVADVLGDDPPEVVAGERASRKSEPPLITSIKNAVVDELRGERGKEPMVTAPPESQQAWLDAAGRALANDSAQAGRLIDELLINPRPVSDLETAMLQMEYRRFQTETKEIEDRLFAANDAGDVAAIAVAQAEVDAASQWLDRFEQATKAAGTEWGRAGVARQIELFQDYSLVALTRRARVAKGGGKLTPEETSAVRQLSERMAALEKKLADLEAKASEMQATKAVEEAVQKAKARPKPQKGARKAAAQQRVAEAWAKFNAMAKGKLYSTPVELVPPAIEVIRAYIDLGVASLAEVFSRLKSDGFVSDIEAIRETFSEAWRDMLGDGSIEPPMSDPGRLDELSRFAQKVMRAVVESGITERDAVVDAVHQELQMYVPDITRRQTMDAMSGYGNFKELSKDDISLLVRDIKGQLQQLAKLEDMEAGQAPLKTGVERRVPSDEERRLIAQVNEAKKRGGYTVTDPAKQLKTALAAAKTAIRNRIADLETEIASRERIVKTRTPLMADAELASLRQRRDGLRKLRDELLPQTLSDAQKAQLIAKALDREIAKIEQKIQKRDLMPKILGQAVTTPEIDAKRATLESLRAQLDELRAHDPQYQAVLAEKQNAAYKRGLLQRLENLQKRIANHDFAKKPKAVRELDEESKEALYQIDQEKRKFRGMEEAWRRKQAGLIGKSLDTAAELLRASRSLRTSMDWSAIFRQAGVATAAHPIMAMKSIPATFRATVSERGAWEASERLRRRPNHRLYMNAKLSLMSVDGKLSAQEEAYMSHWSQYIPFVAASERAYVTFLNEMRADLFDFMVAGIGDSITLEQAKVIANYVNVATGRGGLGKFESAAVPAATILFSPRLLVSRIQYLVGQPLWKGDAATRKAIAKEYARTGLTLAAFYTAAWLLSKARGGDDDDRLRISFDWRSSDFGKLRIGNARIDPLAGFSQVVVLVGRLKTGKTLGAAGYPVDLVGENAPHGGTDLAKVMWNFVRSKFAPAIGMGFDIAAREDYLGYPVTPASAATNLVTPLALQDVISAYRELGIPSATAATFASLLGMGLSVHNKGELSEFSNTLYRYRTDETAKGTPEARRFSRANDLLGDLKKLAKTQDTEGRDPTTTELYAVGLARWALGRRDMARYPNPIPARDDLPKDVKTVVFDHLATAADTASGVKVPWEVKPESLAEALAAAEYIAELGVKSYEIEPYLGARLRKQGMKLDGDAWDGRLDRLRTRIAVARAKLAKANAEKRP